MRNLRITVPTVDGSARDFDAPTGRDLIHMLLADDWAAPPKCMVVEATTEDRRLVRITIPYDNRDTVRATVKDITDDEIPFLKGDAVLHRDGATGTVQSCEFNGPVIVKTKNGAIFTWDLADTRRA